MYKARKEGILEQIPLNVYVQCTQLLTIDIEAYRIYCLIQIFNNCNLHFVFNISRDVFQCRPKWISVQTLLRDKSIKLCYAYTLPLTQTLYSVFIYTRKIDIFLLTFLKRRHWFHKIFFVEKFTYNDLSLMVYSGRDAHDNAPGAGDYYTDYNYN